MWGAVRLLMVVEEHGSGKQLLCFRLWPRCSTWGVVLLAISGALSIAAWLDSAWLPSAILGASSMFLCFRLLQECGSAMAVLLHTLDNLHGEEA
jgi:hypothetical protein